MTLPQRLAAPAPESDPDDVDPSDASPAHIDELFDRWASWSRTRCFYGPPPLGDGVLGKLTTKGSRRSKGGPNAGNSPELSALNLAIAAQPCDTARRVFELHYLYGVANIKAAATQLGISRGHWYRLLAEFKARAYGAHHRILAANLAAAASLPHIHTHQP